jgi:hypothetical protein
MRLHLRKLVALAAFCLLLAGCAQTGPPLPPSLELPKPPTDLRISRKGARITLTWSEPTLTTDRQSVRYIGPTLICRSLDAEIAACGSPVATLPAPPLPVARRTSKETAARRNTPQKTKPSTPTPLTYVDTLPPDLQHEATSAEVTYAVEVLNRNGRVAGMSNRVHVPAISTLPPPNDLTAHLTDDGVVLNWTSPGDARDLPSVEHRYRIYRFEESSSGKASARNAIAGELPLDKPGPEHFTDSGFEWEKTYLYRVTTVTIIKRPDSEEQIEGDDTAPVPVFAHDIFPPAVPAGLQAAYSGEGQKPFIDLIWAPVTNSDVAGYNVYRSDSSGGTGEQMAKLISELVKSPSYRDFAVSSGKTYTYSVSAVDVRGNESRRSEPASESVP